MYRKPKFLEVLHEIREEMSREADYDVDLFAEKIRLGDDSLKEQKRRKRIFTIETVITTKKKAAKKNRKREVGS
jgi:DNA-binding ferritin-like protein